MQGVKIYLFIASICLFSFFLTYLVKKFAIKTHMISIPNKRSLHDVPTPHGGGLAIVLSWYIGISCLLYWELIERQLYFALISGILLAIISLLDDIREINPIFRLFIQLISVMSALYFLGELNLISDENAIFNFRFVILPLIVIGMIWFINLFNFMDGADGFASIEAISVALVLFCFSGSIIPILLIACIAGFLYWNLPKAKIFMGDIGSTQIGFILVVLGIYFNKTNQFSLINWIFITSPFWFDASLTLFRRWLNNETISDAHRKHLYQRAVQSGLSHFRIDLYLILINLSVFFMILVYEKYRFLQLPFYILILLIFFLMSIIIGKKVPFK